MTRRGDRAIRSSATAALAATTGLVALVGCVASSGTLDAPIDWSTVDGSPGESVCGLPAGDQSPPETPPAVTWQERDGVEIPVSPTLGPGDTSVMNRCYAHSPSGALLAAVELRADEIRHGNGTVIVNRAARTGERLSALVDGEIPDVSDLPHDATGELIGYRFESARDDDVTVSLAWASTTSGRSTSARIRLLWEDQDWKVVMQPSNGMWSEITADDPLDRFVRWGGSPGDSTDARAWAPAARPVR